MARNSTTPVHWTHGDIIEGVNWNTIPDPVDLDVWNRVTANFWLPEKIAVSNDIPSWNNLTVAEQNAVLRVFTGLTMLDTIQSTVGAVSLIKDSVTPHEESVYSNFVFMEAFAAGTEILTSHGWKPIEEINEDDLVGQYDPNKNETSFAKPKIVPPHFSEEVYEIAGNNGNARQVVSGGHRVYFEETDVKENHFNYWKPAVAYARDMQHINLKTRFRRFRSAAPAASGAGMTNIDRLLVAVNADGSFCGERYTGEKTGTIPVRFSFSKERKIQRIHELSESAGWKLHRIADSGDRHNYRLDVPLEYVGQRDKRFDSWWNLSEKSSTWCQEFIKEIGLWDGHTLKGGSGVTFYTSRKHDSDFVVAVSSLAGYRSRTTVRFDDRSETHKDNYVTNISWNVDTVNAQSMNVRKVEPQMVYCIQVPTTFLVTRNGESPVISGNCVHAKSYSNIFMTLSSTEDINEAFRWSRENKNLQRKGSMILEEYHKDDPIRKKVASVLLESFLFYSGFYLPLRLSGVSKLPNTADIIRLIVRDESVHGYYIGYKAQQSINNLTEEEKLELQDDTIDLLMELYDNEVEYTQDIYDELGWTEDVKGFLRYNANKALQNLGFNNLFPTDDCQFHTSVRAALSGEGDENHDFFSGSGSSYVMGVAESTEDDDWDFD